MIAQRGHEHTETPVVVTEAPVVVTEAPVVVSVMLAREWSGLSREMEQSSVQDVG